MPLAVCHASTSSARDSIHSPLVRREATVAPHAGKPISFHEAALLALKKNPGLQAFDPALRAADGMILQASLRPNPNLEGQVENILGSGSTRGFDAAESTVAISQLIEKGGKRQARTELQVAEKELVRSDYEIARRELFAEVGKAFGQTLAAQEKVDLYAELVALNESFLPEIDKRVEAGKVTAVERVRAKTAVSTARLATQQAQRELRTAALRLAATWGGTPPRVTRVAGSLADLPSPADQASLEKRLYAHPAYQKQSRVISKSQAQNRLAIAKGANDVTVRSGVRHFGAGDEVALVVGFSLELPFRNRNQGEIAASEAEIEAAQKQRSATLSELKAQLDEFVQTLAATRREVATIQSELLPSAQEVYDAVQDGCLKGRFGYLDLIEARRNLTEARVQLLTASAAYHEAAAEIAGLTDSLPGDAEAH